MANKHQVINGVILFMDNHMIPKAEGNYKIILRAAKAGMQIAPDKIWNAIKSNSLIEMLGVVSADDQVDLNNLARILSEAIGTDEFCLGFDVLGQDFKIYITGEDVHTLKNYIERS